jgi:hypothetical protein
MLLGEDDPMQEIAPGLHRWTAWYDHWEEAVGALAVETADGLVFIDPIDPPSELGKPDHVLVTVYWHCRATGELGAEVWASTRSAQPLRNRGVDVAHPFRGGDDLPGEIVAFQTARTSEVVYWLPEQRAVVAGDVLLGAGAKPRPTEDPLRLCPERWLGKKTHEDLRETLRPLLDLPIERILVSHGAPVADGGKQALAAVLD